MPYLPHASLLLIVLSLLPAAGAGCRAHSRVALAPIRDVISREGASSVAAPGESVLTASHDTPLDIDYPDARRTLATVGDSLPPRTLRQTGPTEPWPLTLDEVVGIALGNSEALRELGGRVTLASTSLATRRDPAIQELDPLLGVQAALSEFDAQFLSGLTFRNDERTFNNLLAGGGINQRHDRVGQFYAELNKVAAAGTRMWLRYAADYDRNNAPNNLFPSYWDTFIEGGVRQPLLQGGGVEFNQIAGPRARPGVYNGVRIARLRVDIQMVDFEIAVRDLLVDVQATYWRLYLAYRVLDARRAEYDQAVETWRIVHAHVERGEADGQQEALARERMFAAKAEVENALNGLPADPLEGSERGLLAASRRGVYALERQLRFLMGLAANDGRLIRPADELDPVDLVFDWQDSLGQAISLRPELRRQQTEVRRRELECIAARSFGRIRADAFGDYRFRGFGDGLFGTGPQASALGDLFRGDLQEWRVGLEMQTPVGNRIGHVAIRHAQLALARARALHESRELQVTHELSAAIAELDRAYAVSRTQANRRVAAREQLDAQRVKFAHRDGFETDTALQFVLAAQQRSAAAEIAYWQSLVDHTLAISRVHVARGTVFEYLGVQLAAP